MRKLFNRTGILLCAAGLLAGCATAAVTGAATGAAVVHDRRTAGSLIEDQAIELKAYSAFHDDAEIWQQTHISVTSYNGIVLMSGEAPEPRLKAAAERLVRGIEKVRTVHNELSIAAPSSTLSRSSDTLITSKVKTLMLTDKGLDPTRVKVVTENGTVYLMGLVSHAEADLATDVTRQTSGVQRVVKLFEYID
jgi:osmotically-inducible protein OsmY